MVRWPTVANRVGSGERRVGGGVVIRSRDMPHSKPPDDMIGKMSAWKRDICNSGSFSLRIDNISP